MADRKHHKYISRHTSRSGETVYVYDKNNLQDKSFYEERKKHYIEKGKSILDRIHI